MDAQFYGEYMKLTKKDDVATLVSKDNRLENATSWLTLGVDFESRRIDLVGEVNEYMQAVAIRSLLKMTEQSHEPVEIYLSTYGGDAYSGLSIYDAIRNCPCDVAIFAHGKIMSAGTIIFLAGDIRVAAPSTRFMIHSASTSTEGKVKDMDVDLTEAKFVNSEMIRIYTERTKMKNPKFWQKKLASHDIYFGLTEAKEYGMIKDKVVTKEELKNVRKPRK